MPLSSRKQERDPLIARINRKRVLARLVIGAERLWVLLLPLLIIVALFLSLAWFGYFRMVPDWARILTLAVLALGTIGAIVLLSRFRRPRDAELDRHLETHNEIAHQALSAQEDDLVSDQPFARALWDEHRRRMAATIDRLGVGMPRPDTPRRDPLALRAIPVLLLVVALAYSQSNQAGRISDAFVSHAVSNAPAVRVDAWVAPPAYTKRAPIFLTAANAPTAGRFDVPAGSDVVVRVTGGAGDEQIRFTRQGETAARVIDQGDGTVPGEIEVDAPAPPTGAARVYSFKAQDSGELNVEAGRDEPRGWTFRVIADEPPTIEFAQDLRRAVNGALEVAFVTEDDYGVESATALIEPLDAQSEAARPLYEQPDYRLPLQRRGARVSEGRASHDLTEHPWAGSRVKLTLIATDASGQEGRSETREVTLPARSFSEPLAQAFVEHRRIMALDANQVPRVLTLNDALATAPEETFDDLTHFLLLKSARSRIVQSYNDDMLRDAADYLWEIALGIEDGDLSLAERRLRDAQRNLAEALENGATDEEIQALMDELREAMQDYMQALAEEMRNSDQAMEIPEGAMENLLRQQDIESMLDQIENLARQGARDEAQQMLTELQRMMNNLQAGRQQQQPNNAMRQQMDRLGELMQQQQQLMNETFQLDQALRERMQEGLPELFDQPPGQQQQQQQGQSQQGEGPEGMTREELQEALRQLQEQQQALQEQLGELTEQLEGMGIQPGEGFGEAGEAMGDAAGSLGEGRGDRAVGQQGEALEALRQGAQQMMNQMMQAMGEGEGEGEGQGTSQMRPGGTDPLGRPRSNDGPDFGDSVRVPDEIDIQRAREILEAIRERLGNALSPDMERQYLERLLEMR